MSWIAVAKKEYLENVRNAWVISVTLVFFVLTLLASLFASATFAGGGTEPGFADLVTTFAALQFTTFFLPILAIMLGFGTLAGERESGSLGLLVAQPLSRGQILLGKYVGLYAVLATAILVGFGTSGLIILSRTNAPGVGVSVLGVFLGATLLWGAAWMSVTVLISAWFNRRGTAIAGGIATWFFFSSFVWNILIFILVLAIYGERSIFMMGEGSAPGWFILTQVLNPNTVYDGLLVTSIEDYPAFLAGFAQQLLPSLYTMTTFLVAIVAWIGLPLYGAYALFNRRDV